MEQPVGYRVRRRRREMFSRDGVESRLHAGRGVCTHGLQRLLVLRSHVRS